jgi:nucleoside-diphosphate-sugar epimerase/coenzyme F420-reducing hydrogenase beta subunit
MATIQVVEDVLCTGCSACLNICAQNAITMKLNHDGFYAPEVDAELCTDCGLCAKRCPALFPNYVNKPDPDCFALMAEDAVRMRSSSGGAFELLAGAVLKQKGYVCGAAWKEDFSGVEHILINAPSQLEKLQLSKYIQSDIGLAYRQIQDLLADVNTPVLFSGCPCQVAGLYAYLGKDMPNLLTVDLLCHGIPSVTAYHKYREDTHQGKSVSSFTFKGNKEKYGWAPNATIHFADGSSYDNRAQQDVFFRSYLQGLNKNKPCGSCQFARLPRQGDITIGDFWGIEKEMNDNKGTSVVLLNNSKGQTFFQTVKQEAKHLEAKPLEAATAHNPSLYRSPSVHTSRGHFFKNLPNSRFAQLVDWCLAAPRFDVGIVGIPTVPNLGGALTYFALYHTLRDMGHSVTMISRPRSSGRPPIAPGTTFEKNPYPPGALRLDFKDKKALFEANHHSCDSFVVGSDQLFNADLYKEFGEFVTLDWVADNHRKIAYAASFGHNFFWGDENTRAMMAHYMQKFDAFSVREESGVDLAFNMFGVEAEWVLDPVFLCNPAHYEQLASQTEELNDTPHIFSYILDPDEELNKILAFVKQKLELPVDLYSEMHYTKEKEGARFSHELTLGKVEKRLYSLLHSNFIVTDSFHGVCFAIIFQKPFVAVLNKKRGASRFYTILSKCGLLDHMITSLDELIKRPELLKPFDYASALKQLEPEIARCRAWLRQALSYKKTARKSFSSDDLLRTSISAAERSQVITDIKLNALLDGRLFMSITDINEYLEQLAMHKSDLLICIAVKDTPGLELTEAIAEKLKALGLKQSLQGKHWHSYAAVINGGSVVFENLSAEYEESRFVSAVEGIPLKVVSKSFKRGNIAFIALNGLDYSANQRGLNIVVCDPASKKVIDTVSFDTHSKTAPCRRFGKLETSKKKQKTLTSGEKSAEQAGATVNSVPSASPGTSTTSSFLPSPSLSALEPVVSRANKNLLDGLNVISAFGGNALDYCLDKKIQRVFLYGTDHLLAYLWELAYYSEIEVVKVLSNKEGELDVLFPRVGKVSCVALGSTEGLERSVPIIFAGTSVPVELVKLQTEGYRILRLADLTHYSHIKRALLDKVLLYQREHPHLMLAALDIPSIQDIKNPSDHERFIISAPLSSENRQKVYQEVYASQGKTSEYIQEVLRPIESVLRSSVFFCADKTTEYVNCVNGYRCTTDTPQAFSQTMYFFGNSQCYGIGADDTYTIASVVQRELNACSDNPLSYAVLNCANGGGLNAFEQWKSFEVHAPQNGDAVVLCMRFGPLLQEMFGNRFAWFSAKQVLDRPHALGEVFVDKDHTNFRGYEAMGKAFFNFLKEAVNKKAVNEAPSVNPAPVNEAASVNPVPINLRSFDLSEEELTQLDAYIDSLKQYEPFTKGKVGSIVMNCNPFTSGHRYLVEYASRQVDNLFVFVVEEDASHFPFADRLALVKAGTADLSNVVVIPSGRFVISQITFLAYFKKETENDVAVDASSDVLLFAQKIAPALNISVRFAGEEPFDQVTNQYNATMRRLLPRHGIAFEVIPRKETNGSAISASRVRALLQEKDFAAIEKLVPATTLAYLRAKYDTRKTVLVLGGTRFMGIRLVENLLDKGYDVTIANRAYHPDTFGGRVKRLVLDRLDEAAVATQLQGKSFNLVFDNSTYCSNAVKYVLTNIACDRYIQVSSIAVYPELTAETPEESFNPCVEPFVYADTSEDYGRGKRLAECAACQGFPEVSKVIARIPFPIDPAFHESGDGQYPGNDRVWRYVDNIMNEKPMYVANFEYRCSFVRTTEEADCLVFLAESNFEGTINIHSEGYVTPGEIISYIEEKSGKKATYTKDAKQPQVFPPSHFGDGGYGGYGGSISKLQALGYPISGIRDWLFPLIDGYIEEIGKE